VGPRRLLAAVVLLSLASHGAVGNPSPSIEAIYPNPVAAEDAGEFVVVSVPRGMDAGELALSDGDATVEVHNVTGSGQVTLSTDPGASRELLDRPVYGLPDSLELANVGERLRLVVRANGSSVVLDSVTYSSAPEGELLRPGQSPKWQPLGVTDRPVVRAGPGRIRAFVLPDAPEVPVEHLRGAERRILLAGYTLRSRRVADRLVAAARRNVTVRVLVDAGPVGGTSRQQARVLDRLVASGVEVRALGGPWARYRFHHAKYAVVDGRALVTTENWKPSGTGGRANRGWGVVTGQSAVVDGLVATFRADTGWRDARPWTTVRERLELVEAPPANGSFPGRFSARRLPVSGTRLLVAPDNAEGELRGLLRSAEESVAVQQVGLGSRRQPLVQATLAAARRGVRVRVLLSGAWYVREENRRMVDWLNDRANQENLPLEARVADPRGRYESVHAKGLLVDGDRTVVGSLNWNNNSARNNRETLLVLEGSQAGSYFRRVFVADWRASASRLSPGLVVAFLLALVLAVSRARSIEF